MTALRVSPEELANLLRTVAEQVEDGTGNEVFRYKANVSFELRGPDGEIKDRRELHNLVCTIGKQQILKASSAKYLNQFAYCVIGTGIGAANAADTVATFTTPTYSSVITPTNPDANTLQFVATYAAGTGTGAITESGLADANSAGNLLCRQVFSAINKAAGDSLQVTWQIT